MSNLMWQYTDKDGIWKSSRGNYYYEVKRSIPATIYSPYYFESNVYTVFNKSLHHTDKHSCLEDAVLECEKWDSMGNRGIDNNIPSQSPKQRFRVTTIDIAFSGASQSPKQRFSKEKLQKKLEGSYGNDRQLILNLLHCFEDE